MSQDQYWQTVGQWEEYFYNGENENERTQEANASTDSTTEHTTKENRAEQIRRF